MPYLGDMALGSTINFKFTTVGTTGLPTQLAATTSTTLSLYPSASTTQITAGATLTTDFDGVTGLNAASVALTSGNGYLTATDYDVVLATGTVGGTNVLGYVVGSFSIENRVARPTASSIMAASFTTNAIVATTFAAGAITSTVLAAGAIHSTIFTTGAIVATTFASGAIVATTFAAGAITSTVLAAGAIHSTIFTTGAITNTTFVAGAITSAVLAAGAIHSTIFTTGAIAATTFIAGAITSSVLAAGAIHSTIFTTGAIAATTFISGAIVATTFATDAIASAGFAASAATKIAGATWDEPTSSHVTIGSFGQREFPIRSGTAQAGAAGSVTLDASAVATADYYVGGVVLLTQGTGANQARSITAYNGATKVATISPNWATNPNATTAFVVLPGGLLALTAAQISSAVWDEPEASHSTAGSFGDLSVRMPAALVGGRIDSNLGSITVGAISAAGFAAGAITSTVLAAGAIHSTIFTTGAIVATTFAANAINSTVVADNTIDAATFTAGAIVATTFASGAITSTVLAAGSIHSTIFTTGAIVATTFAANAINATVIADAAIDAATFAANAITSTVLAAGAITSTTFTTGAIVGTTFSNVLPTNFSSLSISAAGLVAITSSIKKNATAAGFMFVMTDMTTHLPVSGLTVVGTRSLDGAAFGSLANPCASVSGGAYAVDLVPADVNGNHVMLQFTNATADTLFIEVITQP